VASLTPTATQKCPCRLRRLSSPQKRWKLNESNERLLVFPFSPLLACARPQMWSSSPAPATAASRALHHRQVSPSRRSTCQQRSARRSRAATCAHCPLRPGLCATEAPPSLRTNFGHGPAVQHRPKGQGFQTGLPPEERMRPTLSCGPASQQDVLWSDVML
jgi:hypothetical protein